MFPNSRYITGMIYEDQLVTALTFKRLEIELSRTILSIISCVLREMLRMPFSVGMYFEYVEVIFKQRGECSRLFICYCIIINNLVLLCEINMY